MTSELWFAPKVTSVVESLKNTFGGIPTCIENEIGHLKLTKNNLYCELCSALLLTHEDLVIIKTAKEKLEKHFLKSTHQHKNEENYTNRKKFEDNIRCMFSKITPRRDIPPIVIANLLFLICQEEKNNVCSLCSTNIYFVEKSPLDTEIYLNSHLLSSEHKIKVKEFNDKSREVKVRLEKLFGALPPFILNNIDFIIEKDHDFIMNFMCTACNKPLIVDKFCPATTEEEFKNHLESVDHKRKAGQKVFKTTSNLKFRHLFQGETPIPYYIIKNIEYIEVNRPNISFYCSLCNESVDIEPMSPYKTEQNLKYHIYSNDHENNLFEKRNPQNDVYRRLHSLFESFPNPVRRELKYLGLKLDNFYCLFCECEILVEEEDILHHYFPRRDSIEFSDHRDNVEKKSDNCSPVKTCMEKNFGSVPDWIMMEIKHLTLDTTDDKWLCCVICEGNKKMSSKDQLQQHLQSRGHKEALRLCTIRKEHAKSALKEHLTSNLDFNSQSSLYPLSKFIQRNLMHITFMDTSRFREYKYNWLFFDDDSDDSDDPQYREEMSKEEEKKRNEGNNFVCEVCAYFEDPCVIRVEKCKWPVSEELVWEITEYNFRKHFLSEQHKLNLKEKANIKCSVIKKLDSLFGGIPKYAKNSISSMVSRYGTDLYCSLCMRWVCVSLSHGSKESIEKHFLDNYGENKHQIKEKEIEQSNSKAMEIFDMRFWQVPEVILKSIDFFSLTEPDKHLFCELCQETLYIDEYNLEKTESDICLHVRAKKHQDLLNGTLTGTR